MSDQSQNQLITVGEAAQALGVTSDLPANKCLTKAEFYELLGLLQPESAPNGVYIMHKNRFLVKRERWLFSNEYASGVAVKTDNCAFVIAKEEQTSIQWSPQYSLVAGCTDTTDFEAAKIDYNGKQNTDAVVYEFGMSETYAAQYCKGYTFPHGVQGYLPAFGELMVEYENNSEVEACMSLIGGKPFNDGLNNNHDKWSSTQWDSISAWYTNTGEPIRTNKDTYLTARPFAAFQ